MVRYVTIEFTKIELLKLELEQDVHKKLEEEIHGVKIHIPTHTTEERMGLKCVSLCAMLFDY